MKLKYEAPKYSRYKNGGLSNKYKRRRAFIWVDPSYDNKITYWWIRLKDNPGKWVPGEVLWDETGRIVETFEGHQVKGAASSCGRIRSIKAFRRRLKQWRTYLPKGTKFTLVGHLVGINVYGKI